MTGWKRLLPIYLGLLLISMVTTRFQVISSTALSSATVPITSSAVVVADNIRRAYNTLVHERQLSQAATTK